MTDPEILHEWAERVVEQEADRVDDEREEELQGQGRSVLRQLDELQTRLRDGDELEQLDPLTRRDLAQWFREEADQFDELLRRYGR